MKGGRSAHAPPALPPIPRTARGQRTRARLIRAAEDIFGDVGYYETRVSEITRRAGVALGTFYLYFPSKEELFRALLSSLNHDLRRALREATHTLASRAAMEEKGLREFFRFLDRHRKLYRIVKQAESVDPKLYREYYERIARGYRRGLEEAMDRGELKRLDPELVAYALMGMADFAASRYVVWGNGLSEAKVHQLAELILRGLLADGPRSASPGKVPRSGRSFPSIEGSRSTAKP
ncbi:MAG: TetR/AcrR family transcriptional regulator [Thermoplasmata archaeon]|nr:TetR/AcrR family transcriptional regulator [Thermoplasmata archaeon]